MEENLTGTGYRICDMVVDERPREKALRCGIKSLTTTELMAIIFSTGISGKSVIQLSNEILADHDGHLSKVARMSIPDFLRRYKGIGKAKALSLMAALELGSRAQADAQSISDPIVRSAADAYKIMCSDMQRLPHEEFWVLLLAQSGRMISKQNISRGGMTATVVDVKVILKNALDNYAAAMILCHNHPSGNLTPSIQDDNLTSKICDAARLLDIAVHDHIIITDGGYYSYSEKGRMPK